MVEKVSICSSPNLGKRFLLVCLRCKPTYRSDRSPQAIQSSGRTSDGATSGCFFWRRCIQPSGNEPLEKATLAKRAVVILKYWLYAITRSSIMRLLAPMMLTGFAALSVDTQKKCFGGYTVNKSINFFALISLFSISACTRVIYPSRNVRALWAEKLATISKPFSSRKIRSKIGSAKLRV